MKKYVVAIDRGSTNVKAVLFDTKGNEVFTSSYPSQRPASEKPGWWEQDMDLMWEGTAKAIQGLFTNGYSPDDILGIFVTGQGNGLMSIDKNGKPSRMGILSLDSRAAEIHNAWAADGRYGKALQTVGMPFPVGSPLPLLAWLMRHAPEEFAAIDKVLFSKDWIRYKLSDTICTDPTDASGAGLMDIAKREYAWDVFSMLELDAICEKLPPIQPSHQQVGAVSRQASLETGLNEGVPVFCGSHDICAFPFGVGSLDSKEPVTVIGTWGINIVPTKDTAGAPAILYHTVPDYFLTGVGDGNSGGCLDIMINNLCGEEKYQAAQLQMSHYEYIENMISQTKPTGILFHPFIFGSLFNSSACAGLYGIKNWHTKAEIIHAVYEGIVMGHYAYMHIIPGFKDFTSLWLIGGGAKSKVFGQLFADITGLTVKIPKTLEITARGGAMNAWVGLGVYKDHQEACIPPEIRAEYTPNPESHAFYQKKFGLFTQLTELNSHVWSELNEMSR